MEAWRKVEAYCDECDHTEPAKPKTVISKQRCLRLLEQEQDENPNKHRCPNGHGKLKFRFQDIKRTQ